MGKPTIRFEGYTDDWEQRKFSDCYKMSSGYAFKMSDYCDEGVGLINGESIQHGIINDDNLNHLPESFVQHYPEFLLKENDIVVGLNRPITNGNLKIARIPSKYNDSLLYQRAGKIVYKTDCDKDFTYVLLSQEILKHTLVEAVGSDQPFISTSKLDGWKMMMPSDMEEQVKIGEYFQNLDHLITLHHRKCEETKKLKKFMLQKMFPKKGEKVPDIRFDGFTDDWEQRKLGELVGIYDGVHQTPDYQDSGIMFLSVENIATLKSEKYISEEAFERDYKVYPEKSDILMTRIGDVGTTNVVETAEKVAFYVSLALLKPNGIDSYFLSNAMKTNAFQKGLRERTLVTAIPQKINKDEIGKIDIFITNNDEEQKKIGAYFSNLDHLITLHQHKCEELQNIKKFMLQNMFT